LPAQIEADPKQTYRIRASNAGHHDFEAEVSFADGAAQKSITVTLEPVEAPDDEAPGRSPSPPRGGAPAAGGGTLAINSIPISKVLLDGKPVGKTPLRMPAKAGVHTVLFIHPKHGKKTLKVNVTKGKTAVAAVRF
jgi:serine/threonine-protein kinase